MRELYNLCSKLYDQKSITMNKNYIKFLQNIFLILNYKSKTFSIKII